MTDNVLRPRSATELVDTAVQLLRRHYLSFIIVSGIGMVPFLVLRPTLARLVGANGASLAVGGLLPFLLINIVTSMWFSLAGAAIISAAAQGYLEGRIDVGTAINKVAGRIPAVLYSSFIKGSAITLGLFLFLVGSAWFYATYFAVPATVMLEDLNGHKGVDRSRKLAAGHRWTVLKPLALVLVIYFLIAMAGSAMAAALFGSPGSLAGDVLTTLITIFVYPIVPITEMLVYYDLRIRNEGYDVEVMASRLDPAGSATA